MFRIPKLKTSESIHLAKCSEQGEKCSEDGKIARYSTFTEWWFCGRYGSDGMLWFIGHLFFVRINIEDMLWRLSRHQWRVIVSMCLLPGFVQFEFGTRETRTRDYVWNVACGSYNIRHADDHNGPCAVVVNVDEVCLIEFYHLGSEDLSDIPDLWFWATASWCVRESRKQHDPMWT